MLSSLFFAILMFMNTLTAVTDHTPKINDGQPVHYDEFIEQLEQQDYEVSDEWIGEIYYSFNLLNLTSMIYFIHHDLIFDGCNAGEVKKELEDYVNDKEFTKDELYFKREILNNIEWFYNYMLDKEYYQRVIDEFQNSFKKNVVEMDLA